MRKIVWWIMAAVTIGLAVPAQAVTLNNLKGQKLQSIYGNYAPGGNCAAEPRLTIDDSGFALRNGGQVRQNRTLEYAVSYAAPDYQGISLYFFPLPISDDDLGPLLITVNADEKRGVIAIESTLGPRQRLEPFLAAFTRARFLRCKAGPGARDGATAQAPAPAQTAAPTGAATPWELRPVQGRSPIAYVEATASPHIESLILFCDRGRPALALLLSRPAQGNALTLGWAFSGGTVATNMVRSNQAGTFWQAIIARSQLVPLLTRQSGTSKLQINGAAEGNVNLTGASTAVKSALQSCSG